MSGVLLRLKTEWNGAGASLSILQKSLISGKGINTVPVFGVSRNETLLVDSGQDSVVLAQAFEPLRFHRERATGRSSC